MNTLVQTPTLQIKSGSCFSTDELSLLGVRPTNLQCFEFYHYVLYQKGDKRIVLKPLPHNLFKVIRIYDFIPA